MRIEVDVKHWGAQFDRGIVRALAANREVLKKAVKLFNHEVKQATPIGHPWEWQTPPTYDYVPGALRTAWTMEQEGATEWVVYNDKNYAYRVETGWSKQAPAGMMRITVVNWPLIVDNASRAYKL